MPKKLLQKKAVCKSAPAQSSSLKVLPKFISCPKLLLMEWLPRFCSSKQLILTGAPKLCRSFFQQMARKSVPTASKNPSTGVAPLPFKVLNIEAQLSTPFFAEWLPKDTRQDCALSSLDSFPAKLLGGAGEQPWAANKCWVCAHANINSASRNISGGKIERLASLNQN